MRTSELEVTQSPSRPPSFAGPWTRKAVALTRYLLGLRLACQRSSEGNRPGALEVIAGTRAFITQESEAVDDEGLRREAALASALESLIAR